MDEPLYRYGTHYAIIKLAYYQAPRATQPKRKGRDERAMAIENRRTMTVEEYFQLEENDPDIRYEYIDGHVYAMAGGTANHDTIKSNIQRILWNLLRGSDCRVIVPL